jgi:hypothetical protein
MTACSLVMYITIFEAPAASMLKVQVPKVEVADVSYHLASFCLIYDMLHTLWQHTKLQDIFIYMLKCTCGCSI